MHIIYSGTPRHKNVPVKSIRLETVSINLIVSIGFRHT